MHEIEALVAHAQLIPVTVGRADALEGSAIVDAYLPGSTPLVVFSSFLAWARGPSLQAPLNTSEHPWAPLPVLAWRLTQ